MIDRSKLPARIHRTTSPGGMNRLSRRGFLQSLGLGAGAGALAACGVQSTALPPSGSGSIQLVYQDWRTDWFPGLAHEMLELFHQDQPSISVFYTPDPENLHEQMMQDFAAGTAPDVISGCCEFLPIWAQHGYLLDLGPYVEADLDRSSIEDWDRAQLASFYLPDGHLFALPKYHGALGLYYNRDRFEAKRVELPDRSWSHDDYLQAMKDVAEPAKGVWGSMVDITWDRLQVHVNGWGGNFVDPKDQTRSGMGRAEALDAFEWIRARMWDDRVMASALDVNDLETRQAFIQQRLAMVEDGSWSLKDILEQAPFRVGVTTFPAGPVKRATLATTDGFAIYAGTRHPDAAWELLKFLTSKEYGRAMARAHLLQPARASLVGDWAAMVREQYPSKAITLDIASFADGHLEGYSVTAEVFPRMEDARRLAQPAWDRIFTLGQDPVGTMRQVSEAIEAAQQVAA
jgi:multiple sugar transport system substrate-binding protein